MSSSARQVVITGLGAVTPLGVGASTLHERWAAGACGIVDGAGACSEFDPADHLSVKEVRRLDRFSQFAVVAAQEALNQANFTEGLPYDSIRVGCVIATGIGGIQTVIAQHNVLRDKGAKMVSPLGIPQLMANAATAAVSMKYGLQGQSYGVVSACSAGAHAIGSAMRMIQYGDADAVVAGGAEAALTTFASASFMAMQALSPTGTCRPFDARRDGFVMGEGAGVLVLEEAEAARARGAKILGHAAGYGVDVGRQPPDRARAQRAPRRQGDRAGPQRCRPRPRGDRLHQRPRHLNAAQRRRGNRRAEARARRRAGPSNPGVFDQVGDRAPAWGRGSGRGGGDCGDAVQRRDPADARLRGSRPRTRSRLRAGRGQAADRTKRRAALGDLEFVCLRRPQRRPRAAR